MKTKTKRRTKKTIKSEPKTPEIKESKLYEWILTNSEIKGSGGLKALRRGMYSLKISDKLEFLLGYDPIGQNIVNYSLISINNARVEFAIHYHPRRRIKFVADGNPKTTLSHIEDLRNAIKFPEDLKPDLELILKAIERKKYQGVEYFSESHET